VTKTPIRFLDLFKYFRGYPHQLAALAELEAAMPPSLLTRESSWFKTWSQDGKVNDPPWMGVALDFIRRWEGCRLESYQDVTGYWTIGYGARSVHGAEVRKGDKISQLLADELLVEELKTRHAQLVELIPSVKHYGANQTASLLSWSYNVGLGAVESSTLRQRLNAGEGGPVVVAQELPKWNKANGEVVDGLTARRAAEVKLFSGGAPIPMRQEGYLLKVPFESQNDNASGTGYRECFSSSAAMVAKFYGKVKSDDEYNRIRAKYGDTTDAQAHVKALTALGLNPQFRTNGTEALLDSELSNGRPLMVGWLHKGTVGSPQGGGHWSVVIGCTKSAILHNDPNGEADLIHGGYVNHSKGNSIAYSRKNWLPRWLPNGPGSGWCLVVKP
jgi:GH24 family phage-related lysozyme (muramidase)